MNVDMVCDGLFAELRRAERARKGSEEWFMLIFRFKFSVDDHCSE